MEIFDSLFYGLEVEGPERNELTLFIPKNAKNRNAFLVQAEKLNIKRLYFGAGNDRGIDIPNQLLQSIPYGYSIYLEITDYCQLANISKSFLKRTKIIFVLLQKDTECKLNPSVFKIEQTDNVQWFELCEPIVSDINDDLYKEDKDIEES